MGRILSLVSLQRGQSPPTHFPTETLGNQICQHGKQSHKTSSSIGTSEQIELGWWREECKSKLGTSLVTVYFWFKWNWIEHMSIGLDQCLKSKLPPHYWSFPKLHIQIIAIISSNMIRYYSIMTTLLFGHLIMIHQILGIMLHTSDTSHRQKNVYGRCRSQLGRKLGCRHKVITEL